SVLFFFVFFFSSRRRHTISKRDWSSDVCSSDLQADGQWTAGPALAELAPRTSPRLEEAAEHLLPKLVEQTKESVQVYQLSGFERLCVDNAEPATGLRDTTPRNSTIQLTPGVADRI